MGKIEIYHKEYGCLMVERRLLAFRFNMGQTFVKVMYEKKLSNVKEI